MPEAKATPVTISDVRNFFGGPLKQFAAEWKELSEESRKQIKQGLTDGTYTY